MATRILEKDKQWYMDAVRAAVILNGFYAEDADRGITDYKLRERLDMYPEEQFHEDTRDVADDICRDYLSV